MVDIQLHKEEAFKRSPVTDHLISILRDVAEGGQVTYDALNEAVHMNVRNHHFLTNARQIVEREHGAVFSTIRNVGLYRLKNNEIASYSNRYHRRRLVSDTKRYSSKLESVDPRELQGHESQDYHAGVAAVALREAIASKSVEKQIRKSSQQTPLKFEEDFDAAAIKKMIAGLWK